MTSRVTSLLVCDYAVVRENLLMVVSGGVTRALVSAFPGPAQISLAGTVQVSADEFDRVHEVRICMKLPDEATLFMEASWAFGPITGGALEPGEEIIAPFAVDLRPVIIPRPGPVDVQVHVDSRLGEELTFWALDLSVPPVTQP